MDDNSYLRVLEVLDALDRDERTTFRKRVACWLRTARRKLQRSSGNQLSSDRSGEVTDPGTVAQPSAGATSLRHTMPNSRRAAFADVSKLNWLRWSCAVTFLVLAVVLAIAGVKATRQPSLVARVNSLLSARHVPALDLAVERNGYGTLLVRWNARSVAVPKAGVLEIQDGSKRQVVQLHSSELAKGSIIYASATKDLAFRLDLFDAEGHHVSRFLRVLNGSVANRISDLTGAKSKKAARMPGASEDSKGAAVNDKSVRAAAEGPAPPFARAVPRSKPLENSRESQTLTTRRNQTVSAWTSNPAGLGGNSDRRLSDANAIAARPLREVIPSTTNLGYVRLSRAIDIRVQVRIDRKDGHVVEAQLVDYPSAEEKELASAALIAAQEWVFEPAQVNGGTVSSIHRIVFHFSPR